VRPKSGQASQETTPAQSSADRQGDIDSQEALTTWLQSTPGLSGTVAHLALRHEFIRWDRLVSGPVVVSLGGQQSPHVGAATFLSVVIYSHLRRLLTWSPTCRNACHFYAVGGGVERRCEAKSGPVRSIHQSDAGSRSSVKAGLTSVSGYDPLLRRSFQAEDRPATFAAVK
jgi:hypothetical protein